MEIEIENLKKEIEVLKQQLLDTQIHLQRQKKYQEKNKDKILEYAKEYQKTYYQKKKL